MRAADPSLRITTFVNAETREAGAGFWTEAADRCVVLPRVRVRSRPAWAAGELAALPHVAERAGIDLMHAPANLIPPWGDFTRVLTLHDLMFRRHPHLLSPAMRWGTEAMLPLGARRADLLLTGSAVAREEIVAELGIPEERIVVVHHGIGGLTAPGDATRGARPGGRSGTSDRVRAGQRSPAQEHGRGPGRRRRARPARSARGSSWPASEPTARGSGSVPGPSGWATRTSACSAR